MLARTTHEPCLRAQIAHAAFANLTYTLQQSVAEGLQQIYDMIPDIHVRTGNSTRQRRHILGRAISYMTGLVEETDLETVKDALRKVAQEAKMAATDASRTREGMAAFTRLLNKRLDMI